MTVSATIVTAVADDGTAVDIELPADSVGVTARTAREELDERWPPRGLTVPGPDRAANEGALHRLVLDARSDPAAWDRLESDLGRFAAERVAGSVAVHAALVVVDGVGVMLPGRSFAGKSTLAVTLAEHAGRSAEVVLASDEYTLVDPTSGLVEGWPRAVRLRGEGSGPRHRHVATPLARPVPVGLVAFLRYEAGLADVGLDVARVGRSDAVLALLDETVCARSRPDDALSAAMALTATEGLTVVHGRRGEAGDAARAIVGLLGGDPYGVGG